MGGVEWGALTPRVEHWANVVGRPHPPLSDARPGGPEDDPADLGWINPRFIEWMMGLEDGWVTDVVGSRREAVEVLGNGVVPQQAAAAIRALL